MLKLCTMGLLLLAFAAAAPPKAQAQITVPGFLKMEVYTNITTTAVQALLDDPSYPNAPGMTLYPSSFDSRTVFPDDTHENFGARITGFISPPTSGDYELFLRSDDSSQLFLSTDDKAANLDPAPIAEETGCCNAFLETGATQTSAPKALVAGKKYYIMALYKEGGGGDFCQVAWRKVGDTTEAGTLAPIPAAYISVAVPAAGAVTITKNPANATAAANDYVTFAVELTTTNSPVVVQWLKNGVLLPGVVGRSITLGPLASSDNGAKFSAQVSTPGAVATSTEATLTVTADVTPPNVATVVGNDTFDAVTVTFTEAVTAATAGATANYTFDAGLTVSSATVLTPQTVRLATSKQTAGSTYNLTIKNIADTAGVVAAADVKHPFTAFNLAIGGLKFEAYLGISGTPVQGLLDATDKFPDKPDVVGYVTEFSSRQVFTDASHDNYGGRLSGWIVPKESATYRFFLRSDDSSQLWLSTDETVANAAMIAEETGCCNPFMDPDAGTQTSAPIALTAGKRYYVYALWKDGTGGDYVDVAWRKEGDNSVARALPYISGAVLQTYAAPTAFTAPTVAITNPKPDDSVDVGVPVVLTSTATPAANKTIVKVEYFESKQKIGEALRAPFALTLADLREDAHTIIARATDSDGITAESAPVTFSVGGQREKVVFAAIDDATVWKYDRSGTDLGTAWREKSFNDSAWPSGKALIADESTTTVEPIRTPISRNDDAGTHITTFYFRKHFTLSGPVTAGIKLQLRHVVDDGAVFYINGTEIHRFGLAADATFDATTFFSDHENAYAGPFDISPSVLVQGDNVFAVEVHQASGTSSDMVFGAELVATIPVIPVVKTVLGIDDTTVWKYDRSGTDLGTAWKDKSFNDSAWPSGKALIADESTTTVEPIRTPISRFDDAGNHITTFYYRGHFTLDVDPAVVKIKLRHVVDDGAVFYLNGVEINRLGLAADATFDATTFFADHENAYAGPFDIPNTAFQRGDNVLAAEVHQASGSSSDMVFGAELVITYPSTAGPGPDPGTGNPPKLTIARSGADLKITWTDGGTLQASDRVDGGYTDVANAASTGYTVSPGTGAKFFRVRK